MKKFFYTVILLSLITLPACRSEGSYNDYPDDPIVAETSIPEEKNYTINDDSIEKLQASMLKKIDLTASELPEDALDTPDDWTVFTQNKVSLKLPPDSVKGEYMEEEAYDFTYGGLSGKVFIDETSDESETVLNTMFETMGDDFKTAFDEFGMDYDGTMRSVYKNLLTLTSEDIENSDKDTKNTLSPLGASLMFFKKAYILEKDGMDIFIFKMSNTFDIEEMTTYSVSIFDADGNEYSSSICCNDEDTALKIAVTADIAE